MMPVIRTRNPLDVMDWVDREFGRLGRAYWGDQGNGETNALASYPVDIWEDTDSVFVEAELPGYTRDDINITMEKGVLSIAAERTASEERKQNGNTLLRERRYNRYFRSFTLPTAVDEEHIEAKFADGVLNITMPKRAEVKPRKITVS